ncbi:LysE family translocator [Motilimonas eburnea]|uniref:LysE family translocator n=1 Tax=Motilimonas eburnea TaxID=1737488 RepID=UPI001E32FACE|nr:LysE family translocator [Motilimonas eburnea]MCE2572609.1 LysE family translocator [Motilimonas eburnea]
MSLELWFTLFLICCLGAMSPGPSLALVMRNTLNSGRQGGIITAFSHALGVGVWALLSVSGVALLMVNSPLLFNLVKFSGALFLLYLGWQTWRCAKKPTNPPSHHTPAETIQTQPNQVAEKVIKPWSDGFLMALLSPKIALFFIALFSQFINADNALVSQVIIFLTVSGVDFIWYLLVACALGQAQVLNLLQQKQTLISVSTALILTVFALFMLLDSSYSLIA